MEHRSLPVSGTPDLESLPEGRSPRPGAAPSPGPALLVVAGFWSACAIARASGASMFANFMTQLAGSVLLTLLFLGWWSLHRRIPRGDKLAA